jgi:hypothetical protein
VGAGTADPWRLRIERALARFMARAALKAGEQLVGNQPFNPGDSRLIDRALDLEELSNGDRPR